MVQIRDGVGVIALNSKGQILVAERLSKVKDGINTIALPGGEVEAADSADPTQDKFIVGGKRELAQEAGLIGKFCETIGEICNDDPHNDIQFQTQYIICYVGDQVPQTPDNEKDKFGPWQWLNNWEDIQGTPFKDYATRVPMTLVKDYWQKIQSKLR